MKIKAYGFHHKVVYIDLNEVEEFCTPVYWNKGEWWTVKMKDGSQEQIYVRGKLEVLLACSKDNEEGS